MADKKKLDPNFIKKLRDHYDVTPEPEFIPTLKSDLMDRFSAQQRTVAKRNRHRAAIVLVGTFAALMIVFFSTPVYEVLGQIFLELFPRTESNIAPNYPGQTAIANNAMAELNATNTPAPTNINSTPTDSPVEPTRTPHPLSREAANMNIEEVEEVAGFDILVPALLPHAKPWFGATVDPNTNRVLIYPNWETVLVPADSPWAMEFLGASYDPETNIAYLQYLRFTIKQEPISGQDDCDLCSEVGANVRSIPVQIGDIPGEIAIGVWNLNGETKTWKNERWVQRLRWESDNTVFEIAYFYLPGSFTYDSFVEMAESFE